MLKYSEKRDYERAAQLRDIARALEESLTKTRKFRLDPIMKKGSEEKDLKQLKKALGMSVLPTSMECFDISHISGTFVVASMVRFENGRPNTTKYRRFKVKRYVGNDDFRSMEEIVGRRYKRLADENKAFPDLIIIDGGDGQVSAAMKAFDAEGLVPTFLIGLAKKEETIVFSDGRPPLNLPHHENALRLLQRIRDEAHRFANTYNADLRSKRIRESILEDFEGFGRKRIVAVLRHFGSIEKLKKASIIQLQEVEGIGKKTAIRLKEFLEKESATFKG